MSWLNGITPRIWRAVASLLLCVVLAHAVAPVAAETGRRSGSAFSASTQDVSLKTGSRTEMTRQSVRIDPQVPALETSRFIASIMDIAPAAETLRRSQMVRLHSLGTDGIPIGARAPPAR